MSSVDEKNEKSNVLDKSIGYITALLGIVSTALSIFIAVTALSINERVNELQMANLVLDEKIKMIDLVLKENEAKSSQFENSVRLEAEFRIFNANAFASNYREKGMRIVWLDKKIQSDVENWLGEWINGNNLMTGTSGSGLFARQVVCLRVINAGKVPARKIRLITKQSNFDNKTGKFAQPYYEIDTKESTWQITETKIGDLVEDSQKELLKTQMLIPLAHVSGSNRYFGRVFIPLELVWDDGVQGKPGKMSIDVQSDSSLKSDLESSILGISNF